MRIRGSFVIAIAIAVLILLWMFSGVLLGGGDGNGEDTAAETAEQLPSVRIALVEAQEREASLTIRGRTEALRKVTLRAETTGNISATPVERGTFVAEGDVICEIAMNAREAQLQQARATLAQRRAEYDAAQELGERGFRSDIQRAEALAAYNAAQAALRNAELEVERTQIRAPFDGILDDRSANVGDYMAPGTACGVVVDQDPFLVVGQVSERDVGSLTVGTHGVAQLIDGTRVEGTIRFISTQADAATRTFRVELEVANADSVLRDGITADIIVPVRSVEAHRISPAVLSLSDAGEIGVKVLDEDDTVRFMPVDIVADGVDGFWVRGLPTSARVIVVGHEYVVDGQRVRPVDVTEEYTS